MLPLYKMGNTEDPLWKSMIPGGLMYPDNLVIQPRSCDNRSFAFLRLICVGVIILSTDFDTIRNSSLENSLNVSDIQQASKNVDQTGDCLTGRECLILAATCWLC